MEALIQAEDESDGEIVETQTPYMALLLPEDFNFYCEWYNMIVDEVFDVRNSSERKVTDA